MTVLRDGLPLAGREVTVAQRSHTFLFGCTGFEFVPLIGGTASGPDGRDHDDQDQDDRDHEDRGDRLDEEARDALLRRADLWFDLFNATTLPFYWGGFEPVRGRPDTDRLLRTARWFTDRGCVVKGHPLAWHTVTADWLLDLPTDEIAAAQTARVTREVTDFAGVVDMWDVINEVVIMPVFDRYDNGITRLCRQLGRIPTIRMVFEAAREANPHATLLLNDFDLSSAYECLVEGVLEAGITVDALGLQTHMHQGYWGEERTLAVLERFSRYGLPLHLTETTLVSGHLMPPEIEDLNDYQVPDWPSTSDGEERQADEVARHYRTLLGHPSVEAVTYWGLADGGWLGAPGGFVRTDGTRKPAYHALHSLIKGAWWLGPTVTGTDEQGSLRFAGFPGDYELTVDGVTVPVRADRPGETAVTVTV